jgi:multicomponent Na+:H+ antiporter subunit B
VRVTHPGSPVSPDSPVRAERHELEPTHRPLVGAAIAICFGAFLVVAAVHLPREGSPLPAVARYAMQIALPKWGTTEPVNEIVYGTRGFDTFGETFLLLAAVLCVVALTRRREPRGGFIGEEAAGSREQAEDDPSSGGGSRTARKAEEQEDRTDRATGPPTPDFEPLGTPAPETSQGMSVVVRIAARVVSPVLAVVGVYLVAWGYSPGGGFPAGAVVAGVILLAYAAFGYRRIARVIQPSLFELLELLGALAIIACEVLGLVLKGSFSANWIPLAAPQTIPSGGILQLFSGSEFIEVGTGLVLVIFAILGMEHDWTPDEGGHS